jgi:hypothetical protein
VVGSRCRLAAIIFPTCAALISGCAGKAPPNTRRASAADVGLAKPCETTLTLDLDDFLREPDAALASSAKQRAIRQDGLYNVLACVKSRKFPLIVNPSSGSAEEQSVTFELLDGERVPAHPTVRVIVGTTSLTHYIFNFFQNRKVYTIVFTRDGRLYDVLDLHGKSAFGFYDSADPDAS